MSFALGLLDQVPVFRGTTANEMAQETVALGVAAESMGFNKFWIAEHHGDPTRGCASPEVLASFVAARTDTIRVGAGCVLLPGSTPLRVAEQYFLLNALAGGRADLGIGRGTSAPVCKGSDTFSVQTAELVALLDKKMHHPIEPVPVNSDPPQLWMMAAGARGALTAAAFGLPLAFAQFAHDRLRPDLTDLYRSEFRPSLQCAEPLVAVAVRVNCADTEEEAQHLALAIWLPALGQSVRLNSTAPAYPSYAEVMDYRISRRELDYADQHPYLTVAGRPNVVVDHLNEIAATYQADQIVLTTTCPAWSARRHTLQLITDEIRRSAAHPGADVHPRVGHGSRKEET